MPPPPFPFVPGPPPCCCGPATEQVVDNVTVVSLTPDLIEVVEGTYQGMKAYGIDGSGIASNTHHEYTASEIDAFCDEVDAEG